MSEFYLISRLDSIHQISVVLSIVSFIAFLLIVGLIHLGLKESRCKSLKIALAIFIVSIIAYVFVPTTIEALMIKGI